MNSFYWSLFTKNTPCTRLYFISNRIIFKIFFYVKKILFSSTILPSTYLSTHPQYIIPSSYPTIQTSITIQAYHTIHLSYLSYFLPFIYPHIQPPCCPTILPSIIKNTILYFSPKIKTAEKTNLYLKPHYF